MTDIDYVERLTKKQAQCNKQHQVGARRITVSREYGVLHTDINFPSVSLIKNIFKLLSVCETKIPSLKWDLDNERNAILRYVEFKIYQGHIKDSHLRRGKISNFIMVFFISSVIYSELLPDIKCFPHMQTYFPCGFLFTRLHVFIHFCIRTALLLGNL